MISARSLGALRVAATLAPTLPRVRARVRAGDRGLLDVRGWRDVRGRAAEAPPGAPRVLTPCAFRAAVADAHQRHRAGERFTFLHLGAGVEPAIDIATPPGGAA